MAEAAGLSKADRIVRSTRLVVDNLPRVAEQWAGWAEDWQADFTVEWILVRAFPDWIGVSPYAQDRDAPRSRGVAQAGRSS